MKNLKDAVDKLKETGYIGLEDFKVLNLAELEQLAEEIQYWCVYGSGKVETLGNSEKKLKP